MSDGDHMQENPNKNTQLEYEVTCANKKKGSQVYERPVMLLLP